MIKYELNGKTVLLTTEQWLELDELKLQALTAADRGVHISDPFQDFNFRSQNTDESDIEIEIEQIPDEEIKLIIDEFNDSEE